MWFRRIKLLPVLLLFSVSAFAQGGRFGRVVSMAEPLPACTSGSSTASEPMVWDTTLQQLMICKSNAWTAVGLGGTNSAVQFNSSGAAGGDATNFSYDTTTHNLTITGEMSASGYSIAGSSGPGIYQGYESTCPVIPGGSPSQGYLCIGDLTSHLPQYGVSGGLWRTLVDVSSTQSLTNKTIDGVTPAGRPATSDAVQFVSANGNDSNDGLSWGTAKLTIAAACAALPSGSSDCSTGSGVVYTSPAFPGYVPSSTSPTVVIETQNLGPEALQGFYLASGFLDTATLPGGIGAQYLDFFISPDGISWKQLAGGYLYVPATGFVRDPSYLYYQGKYFVAYTMDGNSNFYQYKTFGIASSADLKTWNLVGNIDPGVTSEVTTWAPELYQDTDGSVYVVFTTTTNLDSAFQIYIMKATDSTLANWSAPTLLLTTSAGGDPIDPYIVKYNGTYYLWFTNHTAGGSDTNAEYATSSSITGAYTVQTTGNWNGWGAPADGTSIVRIGAKWRAYFTTGSSYYYSESSGNFATWSAPVAISSYPMFGQGTVKRIFDLGELQSVAGLADGPQFNLNVAGSTQQYSDRIYFWPLTGHDPAIVTDPQATGGSLYITRDANGNDYAKFIGATKNTELFGSLQVSGTAAKITSGSGAPTGACTTGSLYSRTDGGTNTAFYVCGSSAWVASGSLSGVTTSIGGSALTAGNCATGTVSITGASAAVTAGAVIMATPHTYPGNGFDWNRAYISSTDTVTVQVCADVAGTPTASTYNVKVVQ